MDKINDGGAAFPVPNDANMNDQEGMTLRDYFAGQVIGAAYRELFIGWRAKDYAVDDSWPHGIAMDAYRIADAMLCAREVAL